MRVCDYTMYGQQQGVSNVGSRIKVLNVWVASLGVLLALILGPFPVRAQTHPPPARFVGQVTAVTGSPGSPRGFTLQTKARSIDMRISPTAIVNPRSAEAEVEGFTVGDYATVLAVHVNRAWVAERIDFDVRPVPSAPQTKTVTGTVTRVTVNGKRFLLLLDTGGTRWIAVNDKTQFRVDNQLVFNPPMLAKGAQVVVTVRVTPTGWVAVEVNLKTGGGTYRL